MKKIYFIAAAAALALASCSNSDESQEQVKAPESAQTQQAIDFDAYIQRGLTRAGLPGDITTDVLKTGTHKDAGFGVFAFYTDNDDYDGQTIPNFMYNQQVKYDGSKWAYEPVKYWPNEAGNSAISDEFDRVSFFAYAPWVDVTTNNGKAVAGTGEDADSGIMAFSRNNASGDPYVKFIASLDPAKAVDLLWGTVPSGQTWTPYGSTAETPAAGLPWLNVKRPNTTSTDYAAAAKVKFQFEHALSKLNVQVVTDADKAYSTPADADKNTRIWIRSISFVGFATQGALNLNNIESKKALWGSFNNCGDLANGEEITIFDGLKDGKEATAQAGNEKVLGLNPALIQSAPYAAWNATDGLKVSDAITGVTGTAVNLFNSATATAPIYVIPTDDEVTVRIAYDVETYDGKLVTKLSDNATPGSSISNVITKTITGLKLENGKKYTITLHLGLNSVQFDAAVSDWGTGSDEEAGLPENY